MTVRVATLHHRSIQWSLVPRNHAIARKRGREREREVNSDTIRRDDDRRALRNTRENVGRMRDFASSGSIPVSLLHQDRLGYNLYTTFVGQ